MALTLAPSHPLPAAGRAGPPGVGCLSSALGPLLRLGPRPICSVTITAYAGFSSTFGSQLQCPHGLCLQSGQVRLVTTVQADKGGMQGADACPCPQSTGLPDASAPSRSKLRLHCSSGLSRGATSGGQRPPVYIPRCTLTAVLEDTGKLHEGPPGPSPPTPHLQPGSRERGANALRSTGGA